MNIGAILGLLVMAVSEGAALARIEPFYSWNTPIAWSGFILFADSVAWKVLWESWNCWDGAKWHYSVPIMENLKIFEMPVPAIWVSRHSRSNVSPCICSPGRS